MIREAPSRFLDFTALALGESNRLHLFLDEILLKLTYEKCVTPGVRFADGDAGDQVRVTTPVRAREIGSDYIVVGRPITQAADPVAAYRRCVEEFITFS